MGWDPTKGKGLDDYGEVVGNTLLPGVYDPIKKKVGDFGKKPNKDNAQAQDGLNQAQHAFDGLTAPELAKISPTPVSAGPAVTTQAQQSTAAWDPQARQAQTAQMAALRQLAEHGGRSAASDANLAHIRQQEGAQAQGLRQAALADASRRGMSNGNSGLLAQLTGNQSAANIAASQGSDLAGNMANSAIQAGQGAANIGAGLQGQGNELAQAKDIMSRYNSGQQLNAQEFNANANNEAGRYNSGLDFAGQQYNSGLPMKTFDGNLAVASGKAGGGKMASDYWSKKYGEDQAANGAILNGFLGLGSAAVGAASKGKAYGGEIAPSERINAARGGEVPGPEVVRGDSLLNDIVPYRGPSGAQINLSGGEVVVPKSMRDASSDAIGQFVKHPPKTEAPMSKEQLARKAALAKLARQS